MTYLVERLVYPWLDRRVVEFALGVLPEFFLHNERSQWFARQQSQQLTSSPD